VLGISINKGRLCLLEEITDADIIIASSLGLAFESAHKARVDYDFLSSIEVLILDKAEIFNY